MAISDDELELAQTLISIFMPYAAAKNKAAIDQNIRFVHYTSATAGLEIIKTKRLWMRSTTCMSDYREVQHGFDTLTRYFGDPKSRDAFLQAVNGCAAGAAEEAISLFDQWWSNTQLQTYISCMSEHDDGEDLHGRLSMWRAFGRTSTRIALVVRLPLNSGAAIPLNLVFSPVAYFSDERLRREIQMVVENIRANQGFLQTLEHPRLVGIVFNMLVNAVVCLKHEGFLEEREWRAIYSPKRNPSKLVETATEVVDGVPQLIYKLPLDSSVSADLAPLDVAALFDRIILGPSQYSWAMYEAYVDALTAAGVKDASARVFASGIPVRTGP